MNSSANSIFWVYFFSKSIIAYGGVGFFFLGSITSLNPGEFCKAIISLDSVSNESRPQDWVCDVPFCKDCVFLGFILTLAF